MEKVEKKEKGQLLKVQEGSKNERRNAEEDQQNMGGFWQIQRLLYHQ